MKILIPIVFATQWLQGCAPMANHDSQKYDAVPSLLPLMSRS